MSQVEGEEKMFNHSKFNEFKKEFWFDKQEFINYFLTAIGKIEHISRREHNMFSIFSNLTLEEEYKDTLFSSQDDGIYVYKEEPAPLSRYIFVVPWYILGGPIIVAIQLFFILIATPLMLMRCYSPGKQRERNTVVIRKDDITAGIQALLENESTINATPLSTGPKQPLKQLPYLPPTMKGSYNIGRSSIFSKEEVGTFIKEKQAIKVKDEDDWVRIDKGED
jgi:hypothetical protein